MNQDFINSIPFAKKVHLIKYDECGILAFDKSSGIMTHPNKINDDKISSILANYNPAEEFFYWKYQNEEKRLYLINRLDSPTSGIVIACDNKLLSEQIKLAFKEKLTKKIYYAIVFGKPIKKTGDWSDFLLTQKEKNFVRTTVNSRGLKSETKYSLLKTNSMNMSLMKLEPLTGRTHQLRIQCAKRNLPIVGDSTYGNFIKNKIVSDKYKTKRLFLHCAETEILLNLNGKNLLFNVKCEPPEIFKEIL